VPALGELTGVRLLDIAPTLLEAAGHEIPESFQGRSLFGGSLARPDGPAFGSAEAEEEIRRRLAGLGYIS
jgi:arylsulfatase A-like enzyme